jgi:hypothetical protein
MTPRPHRLSPTPRATPDGLWPEAAVVIACWMVMISVAIGLPIGGPNPPVERSVLTIRVATVFAIGAFWIAALGPSFGRWPWRGRLLWTLAFAAYTVHFYFAYFGVFGGSSARVVARQGPVVAYLNYAVSLLWAIDVGALTWLRRRTWRRWASLAIQTLVLGAFVVAEVLFKSGLIRVMGIAMVTGVAIGLGYQVVSRWRCPAGSHVLRWWRCPERRGHKPMDALSRWLRGTVFLPPKYRHSFSAGELFRQMRDDLIAKEVQTGYTMTYVWMANQLGHVALGFAGVAIPIWAWSLFSPRPPLVLITLVAITVIVLKEVRDFNLDLARTKKADGWFSPARGDLALDAGTASLFMVLGVACGVAAHLGWHYPILPLGAAIATCAVGLFAGGYWLPRKKCFQMAALPFVYRLSDFPRTLSRVEG